jgi:hypothetical protein
MDVQVKVLLQFLSQKQVLKQPRLVHHSKMMLTKLLGFSNESQTSMQTCQTTPSQHI